MIIKLLKNALEFIRNAVKKIYSFFEYFFSQDIGEKYNKKGYGSNLKSSKNKNSGTIVKSSIDQNIDQGAGAFACRRIPLDLSNYQLSFLDYKGLQIFAQTSNLTLKNSIVYNKENNKVGNVILSIIGNEQDSLLYNISFISKDIFPIFVQELLNLAYLIAHELMLKDYFIDKLIVKIDDNNYEKYISKILPITLHKDKFGKSFKFLKKDKSFAELIRECRNKFYLRKYNTEVPDLFPGEKNTALQYPIKFTELLSGYNNYAIKLNVARQTDSRPVLQSKHINAPL